MPIQVRLATLTSLACCKPAELTVLRNIDGFHNSIAIFWIQRLAFLLSHDCINIHKPFNIFHLREINWTVTAPCSTLVTGTTKACLCFTKMY